ncbi:hypothetical protein AKJ58_01670 [candidate division MSBL1 archaeon SCGC-AAA385D11]|uniref:Uncharacterized protein n=1 Tax=candidate division MSBL1 archaeon SCGC-AAA385D11 TaxID=1698286 RepID=A0A133VN31_9EURY|nr:hypothetical protein AKJ58_01670 [candidate division MSBL1 archaeon SCGC-AAA385D11]
MNDHLKARRLKTLQYHLLNVDNWAKKISDEFGCSVSAAREDYRRRSEWLSDLDHQYLDSTSDLVAELLLEKSLVRSKAWKMYLKTKNDNCKLGALKLVDRSVNKEISILQSLGELKKKIGELEVSPEDRFTMNILPYEEENGED